MSQQVIAGVTFAADGSFSMECGLVEGGINIGCLHCFTLETWMHAHEEETGHDCAESAYTICDECDFDAPDMDADTPTKAVRIQNGKPVFF